jgi:bifunctional non-homologous end joining protein LigD
MLATSWKVPFSDPDWRFEVKWDGVRALLYADQDTVVLRSRSGRDITGVYPELAGYSSPRSCVLDGEIIAFGDGGRPSFEVLQQRMNMSEARAVDAARFIPVSYVVFDVLYDGNDLTEMALEERAERLDLLELPSPMVRSEVTAGEGKALYRAVVDRGLEGVVAKQLGSPYRSGVRSPEWRKIPNVRVLRGVVGGFTPGERGRSTSFGSLLLGLWDGPRLRWVGAVGTGFTDEALAAIRTALDEMKVEVSPFADDPGLPPATWVEPRLVARVEFKEWTRAGRLRAPSFKGFLSDPVEEVTWEAEGPSEY